MAVDVSPAVSDDRLDVLRVLDAAMLDVSSETVEQCIRDERVLVATDDGRVVGALVAVPHGTQEVPDAVRDGVPDAVRDEGGETGASDGGGESGTSDSGGAHVAAVAVRRRRRGAGIGSLLVERALERWRPLTADFDARVKPFYESLGFDVEPQGERYLGRRE